MLSPSSCNSGKRLTQFYEKDMKGRGGGRRGSSLRLKRSALGFKVSFRQAGLRRSQGQREERSQGGAGTRALYISFRSSRVWSSILCVQRCSSLVHFSLSSENREELQKVSFKLSLFSDLCQWQGSYRRRLWHPGLCWTLAFLCCLGEETQASAIPSPSHRQPRGTELSISTESG